MGAPCDEPTSGSKREGSLVETGSGRVPAYLPAGSHIPGLLLQAEAAPGAALGTPYHPQHFSRTVQTRMLQVVLYWTAFTLTSLQTTCLPHGWLQSSDSS